MRILTLINGSLLSEAASRYAICYAAEVDLPLVALFVDNGLESLEKVTKSVETLQKQAEVSGVEFEFLQLEGQVVAQLEHYCKLYAVDTVFCATRRQSSAHSFSDRIVAARIETDIAVVKVKNLSSVARSQRILLVANERVSPNAYVLWLSLVRHWEAVGLIYLAEHSAFLRASSKSGLKYHAAPYVQIAALSGCAKDSIEVISNPKPMSIDKMLHYQMEQGFDLVVYTANAYSQSELMRLGDDSSINSILFYPWSY